MTTRSKQIAWGRNAIANTSTTVYTCPSGKRTIIKQVNLYNNAATTKNFNVIVSNGAGTVYGHLTGTVAVTAGTALLVSTWCVMEAGQELRVFYSGGIGEGDWLISGAELSV